MTLHEQQPYPDEQAALPADDEQSRSRNIAVKLGAGALAVGAVLGTAGLFGLGGLFGKFLGFTHMDQRVEEKIVAESIYAGPLTLECRAENLINVSKSVIPFQSTIGGKDIPGLWTRIHFEDSKIKEENQSVVGLTTCIDTVDESGKPSVEIVEDKTVDTKYALTTIKFNPDAFVVNAQFPKGQKKTMRVNGELWDGGGAALQIGSAATGGACKIGAKLGDLLGVIGDKSESCNEFKTHITRFKDVAESKSQSTAEFLVLKAIEGKGSKAYWEDSTWPSVIDSYVCEAQAKGGAEAVKQLRFETMSEVPSFDESLFDKYERDGIIKSTDDIKADSSKVVFAKAKAYEPECFSGVPIQGPDGKIRVEPK